MHASGLNIPFAAFFIVGEIAGSGVLALPKAIDDTGWIGLVLIVACALLSSYTGSILGQAWLIVQERFPEYKKSCPDPYPVLGEKTFGKKGRPVAVGATLATAVACVLLVIKVAMEDGAWDPVLHSTTEFEPFFMAFGTIVFAFGGHPAFPTFQTDMKKPGDFKWAVLLGYLVVMVMYLPISSVAYFIYGKNVQSNILLTKSRDVDNKEVSDVINQVVEVLITIHLILGLLIVINPFCQELESYARVPRHFTWKRCVFRSVVVIVILFVAESIPKFGAILSLVGGSTVTLLAYICPSLFYLKLKSVRQEDMVEIVNGHSVDSISLTQDKSQGLPLWVKVMNIEIILLGTVAGIASTYSAIKSIINSNFSKPCYL